MDDIGPEISDLIVDFDPHTLERLPIRKADVLARLRASGQGRPLRIAERLPERDGVLDPDAMDAILIRSHLELQRLHEEFGVCPTVREIVAPLIETVRRVTDRRPIRIVDVGCGLGVVSRWLALRGDLGDDVELVGVDYNRALVHAAAALAEEERLPVKFIAGNAFHLETPAHIFMSTGVLHHFRGPHLTQLFTEHQRVGAFGFVHIDIRPWLMAGVGSWVFHRARMREPLAQWDGYWSAVRAHPAPALLDAAREGAPAFRTATLDADPGVHALVRIFQVLLGVKAEHAPELLGAYARFGARFAVAP